MLTCGRLENVEGLENITTGLKVNSLAITTQNLTSLSTFSMFVFCLISSEKDKTKVFFGAAAAPVLFGGWGMPQYFTLAT